MKSLYALLFLLPAAISFSAFPQEENTSPPRLAPGYYIVVAAYRARSLHYVKRFASKINRAGRHAQYGYDGIRKFYYVYLDYYTNFDVSIKEMLKTRKAGGFTDAWVRIMKPQAMNENVNLLVESKNAAPTSAAENGKPKREEEIKPAESGKEAVREATVTQAALLNSNTVTTDVVDNPKADPVYRPQNLGETPVFLSLYNPMNNSIVQGEIEVIDTDRSKQISKVKGNDYLTLPDPKNKSGKLTLVSSAFGYRRLQLEINYKSTEQDTLQAYVSLVGNYYMITFDMVRLHRGDIATLYNVYFYNDAAVMLPESKYELNNLLQMMRDNPRYRIRLHGHTNGSAHGRLITMGESKNFFELTSDVKNGFGSAKDLSRERAEVIRRWLLANDVSADRMDIKAWGGSRMIHDKNSVHARKNVRVEVEVLQD
jgi:outer membrane protein OmpA-like peptidoglycan-associated protein